MLCPDPWTQLLLGEYWRQCLGIRRTIYLRISLDQTQITSLWSQPILFDLVLRGFWSNTDHVFGALCHILDNSSFGILLA